MTDYFLGIDVGGTKSDALIASQDGQIVGISKAGCGNWESIGYEGMASVLQQITQQALDDAGLQAGQISGAGFGISGFDWPSQYEQHMEVIRSLGLACPLGLVNDALVGLLAGSDAGWGVAVIAGTGCNCWGLNAGGRVGRVTGEGLLFDEEGGAGTLVTKAIRAISRQWSKRGPETHLTEAFLESKGVKDVLSFLEGLSLQKITWTPEDVRIVFKVADEGDPIAQEIVEWTGERLADLVCGVIRQLELEDKVFDVVKVGSLWKSGPRLGEAMRRAVHQVAPGAHPLPLLAPPAVGGILLGMQHAGVSQVGMRQALVASCQSRLVG